MDVQSHEIEIFGIEDDDGRHYLYAPLEHAAALVNATAAAAVNRFLQQGVSSLTPGQLQVIEQLREQGMIHDLPAQKPVSPPDYLFRPCEVTLFPTTCCNLRCIYCYADAGDSHRELSWDTAKPAIDFVIENAMQMGRNNFVLGFHGGGEPMSNWPLVVRAVNYARQQAYELGIKVQIHAASNGILNPKQRRFISDFFSGINLSIDGPKDIHNTNRPRIDGSGSFDQVMETVRYFEETGFPYGVRTTITEQSVPRMKEIVAFFREACPSLDQLHVEPVWYCGRCKTSGTKTPDHKTFIDGFLEAWEEGSRSGLNLFYSGARLGAITNKFCAAPGDGFSVTPEGIATSCFEVTDAQDPRAALFHYGRFDPTQNRFLFDTGKIEKLRRLTVENIPHCRDCFCKWHCAGDCLAKVMPGTTPDSHQGSPRCRLTRTLTFSEIRRILNNAAEGGSTGSGEPEGVNHG